MKRVLLIECEGAYAEHNKFCCDRMKNEVEYVCPTCEDTFHCPDTLLYYSALFDEYGLLIHDGSGTYERIEFCPWCDTKLPESKRDDWFNELMELGYDSPLDQEIPEKYRTTAWYK